MNNTYTAAQFVRGLRESRNEERQRIINYLTKQLVVNNPSGRDLAAARTITDLIEDIKAGEHDD